jgi:hypothetical protein
MTGSKLLSYVPAFLLALATMTMPGFIAAQGPVIEPRVDAPKVPTATRKIDPFAELAIEFAEKTRPLMKQFCLDCHSTSEPEGELDLERFATLGEVRRGTKAWLKVAEMLDNGEMPPKDAEQPAVDERKQLRGWVERYLHAEALANAGDPGPVVLRRLSNAEYTYTIQDLTGLPLEPAKQFPADSASGEGFANTGNSLVMSPALLTKYLDAGKAIASHAVLLPDGIRFSPSTTRRDWTDEILAQIRDFYRGFTDEGGSETVTQQGIALDKNKGGGLPLKKYLLASLELREPGKSVEDIAAVRGLSAKYLGKLVTLLSGGARSPLLDGLRARWRVAKPEDVADMVSEISEWQKTLWKFSSVGHIGKVGGPKAWMEPVTPLAPQQESRIKLAAPASGNEVVVYFAVGDAGDGPDGDFVVWQQPRLVIPGRSPILLRDVRRLVRERTACRERVLAATAKSLAAAAEASAAQGEVNAMALADRHGVDTDVLKAWLDYLGVGTAAEIKLDHFTHPIPQVGAYDFIKGWGSPDLPSMMANSSGQHVRIPGNMKPHGVVVHPTPKLCAAAGWRSPVSGVMRIEGMVTHAHPECGNGVTWSLELRRGNTRQRLAGGIAQGGKGVAVGPIEKVSVQPGDLVSLLIGPRDGDHSCDLTDLELKLSTSGAPLREWSLTGEISDNILAGNPHADKAGNAGVWHFYSEPVTGAAAGSVIPAGSLLARWQATESPAEKQQLAEAVQKLLTSAPPAADSADAALYRQLTSLAGPLMTETTTNATPTGDDASSPWGLDAARFGKHPNGSAIDAASLCVQAPSVIEVRLPADLVVGTELMTTGLLDKTTGAEGSVQLQVVTTKPGPLSRLQPSGTTVGTANGTWSSNNQTVSYATPIVVNVGSAARQRFEASFDEFRQMFPAALCYTKIVPVDEVVTLTLHHREDDYLARLILDDAEKARLDRLWSELRFVSQDALALVDAFEQLLQFATQDADPSVFEPMRKPINDRAAAFRQLLIETEPKQVDALLAFASRAFRHPLTEAEAGSLRTLYRTLREQELPHDEAIRFMLARTFIAPAFLYRLEKAPDGTAPAAISDAELASRLSYFLWSSQPDDELRAVAASGRLHHPDVLKAQTRRMQSDPRVRRLATEFACQWLHIYDFDALDEKSEKFFPEFRELRGDMYEESIRFFTDLFQRDASVLSLFNADHTFVNERLAKFYGISGVKGADWRRVDGIQQYGRGGILGLSATLAKQSGASRTSPILRGTWISEVLLGEKLPKPPKNVPVLPDDEMATDGLTVRQLVARHTSDVKCQGCHQKIDPFGFSLEAFDAIGRHRNADLANRPIDSKTTLPDGTEVDGLPGLRSYLSETRRDAVVRQFCRKLLGYALGRAIQLSDEPLLDEMRERLAQNDYQFSQVVDAIIGSRQFLEIRGKDGQLAESP